MTVFVSLLRGINVGGRHEVGMAELRAVYESLGLSEVRTHLRSGNVLFAARGRGADLGPRIEAAVERTAGFRPVILVLTVPALRSAIADNPFGDAAVCEPARLAVMFLAAEPDAGGKARLAEHDGPEAFAFGKRVLYVHYPSGIGASRLTGPFIERRLGIAGTARNWNTTTKLLALAEAMERGE